MGAPMMPRPKNPTLAKVLILRFFYIRHLVQWSDH
jgi:hypothetical protein